MIADTGSIVLTGAYDAADPSDLSFLAAARDGLRRVFPQTVLATAPLEHRVAHARRHTSAAGLRVHVVVPDYRSALPLPAAASAFDVDVTLFDGRSGQLIEPARLRLAPAWWQMQISYVSVADLFENYAAGLTAVQ